MEDQKKTGVLISYLTIVVQIFINIFITKFLIKEFTTDDYGVYQIITSFANNITVIECGITTIMTRNIAKFRMEPDPSAQENFLFLSLIITAVISLLMFIIGGIAGLFINPLFSGSLTANQLATGKILFAYVIFNLGQTIWYQMFVGISAGYSRFVISNGAKLLLQVLRLILIPTLLHFKMSTVTIVQTDILITGIVILCLSVYSFGKLKIKIKFHSLDKILLMEILLFALASLLQAVINEVNSNFDKTLLGVLTLPSIVTLYTPALLIMNTMIQLIKAIGNVYLPAATELVINNASGHQYSKFIVKPGRIQAIIACGFCSAFFVIGKPFFCVWLGQAFKETWLITMILTIPACFSYITSVANVLIDAMLKKMARSVILLITAMVNVLVSVFLINRIGYVGAAIGTGVSFVMGNMIMLNIYYKKTLHLSIISMYVQILKGTLPSSIVAGIIAWFSVKWVHQDMQQLIIGAMVFVITYAICLLTFGLNKAEKRQLHGLAKKLRIVRA